MTAVDGDVHLVDPEVLAALRGEVAKVDAQFNNFGGVVGNSIEKHHKARQAAQDVLRYTMRLWGSWRNHENEDDRHAQRRFFHTFGIDYMTAQTLAAKDAFDLNGKIVEELNRNNISELRR